MENHHYPLVFLKFSHGFHVNQVSLKNGGKVWEISAAELGELVTQPSHDFHAEI